MTPGRGSFFALRLAPLLEGPAGLLGGRLAGDLSGMGCSLGGETIGVSACSASSRSSDDDGGHPDGAVADAVGQNQRVGVDQGATGDDVGYVAVPLIGIR